MSCALYSLLFLFISWKPDLNWRFIRLITHYFVYEYRNCIFWVSGTQCVPKFAQELKDLRALENEEVIFDCKYTGNPFPGMHAIFFLQNPIHPFSKKEPENLSWKKNLKIRCYKVNFKFFKTFHKIWKNFAILDNFF